MDAEVRAEIIKECRAELQSAFDRANDGIQGKARGKRLSYWLGYLEASDHLRDRILMTLALKLPLTPPPDTRQDKRGSDEEAP